MFKTSDIYVKHLRNKFLGLYVCVCLYSGHLGFRSPIQLHFSKPPFSSRGLCLVAKRVNSGYANRWTIHNKFIRTAHLQSAWCLPSLFLLQVQISPTISIRCIYQQYPPTVVDRPSWQKAIHHISSIINYKTT